MTIYGKDFAAIYNKEWGGWTRKAWPFISKAVARVNPGASSWLDLCCGNGWLLKKACRAGFEAVGVDASSHQLRHARRNAPRAELIRADIRKLSLRRKFDVITCMFDSLNYLTRKDELLGVFRWARRHLAGKGCFIFDMNTCAFFCAPAGRTTAVHRPGWSTIIEVEFDLKRELAHFLITGFVRQGRLFRKFREDHVERLYRPEEIDELLGQASFAFKKHDGSTLSRPRKSSRRLVYVCR